MDARPTIDEIAAELRRRILEGSLTGGARLPQQAIAEEFGVSRTPVREALQKLEATGLVALEPHRGALVRVPSPREIRETYAVRAELEGLGAALAATGISSTQLERLHAAVARFREALARGADDTAWREANTLFHETVHEAAGNDTLRTMLEQLHGSISRNLAAAPLRDRPRLMERNVAEHERVLTAIEAGDADEARRAMARHVRGAGELVAAWFERTEGRA
jgi:DNA-binding GntR family transcriptional regulator